MISWFQSLLRSNSTLYRYNAATPGHPGTISARGVAPVEGSALCFPHGDAEDSPVHEGSAVAPGPGGAKHKYIIRTDVLFHVDAAEGAAGAGDGAMGQ
jgi:hypothetical protein